MGAITWGMVGFRVAKALALGISSTLRTGVDPEDCLQKPLELRHFDFTYCLLR